MVTLSIQASGFDAIQMQLDQFPANATRELGSALLEAGNTLTAIIQQMPPVSAATTGYGSLGIPVAPKYGGTLRQSIHARQVDATTVEVTHDTDYGDFVYFGTVKMQERPFFQWALEDFGGYQAIEEIMQRTLGNLLAL